MSSLLQRRSHAAIPGPDAGSNRTPDPDAHVAFHDDVAAGSSFDPYNPAHAAAASAALGHWHDDLFPASRVRRLELGDAVSAGSATTPAVPPKPVGWPTFNPFDPDLAHAATKAHEHWTDGVAPDASPFPIGHESRKIKVEYGSGAITGAITLTLDVGKSGIALDDGQLRAFKTALSVRANGFVAKLEAAVLSDKLEDEVLDGVKVVVDVSALKVGTDLKDISFMTVALKLQGDISHWLDMNPGVKITLDGSIQIALGGKLAAKLATYASAKLERDLVAKEMEDVTHTVEGHANAAKQLETKLEALEANAQASRREIQAVKDELMHHKLQISTGSQQLEGLAHELERADRKVQSVLGKLEGKFARKVAWAMEKKSVRFIAEKIAKLLPILNVVSTLVDIYDTYKIIKQLALHGVGNGGDAEDGTRDSPAGQGGKPTDKGEGDTLQKAKGSDASSAPNPPTNVTGAASSKADPATTKKAHDSLHPTARRIVDAITHVGRKGPELMPEQLTTLGALIPDDLTEAEIQLVLTSLSSDGQKAGTPEQAMIAIETAVRHVRQHRQTITIDGERQPDLVPATSADDEPITTPSQVADGDGPVTSPVHGDATPVVDDAARIVHSAPPTVIASWFEVHDGKLAMNSNGQQWIANHVNTDVGGRILSRVTSFVTETGPDTWDVRITFALHGQTSDQNIQHSFFVERGDEVSSVGGTAGDLVFEPYVMVSTP